MSHAIEAAPSARAKCRGCGRAIGKGQLRLGERLPSPYAEEREQSLWFHLVCGAYKRPEVLLEALAEHPELPEAERLRALAEPGIAHHRLPRIDGAERAASGRARCRHCREPIARGQLRIRLCFYAEGRFEAGGFIHAMCAVAYFGTSDVVERAAHFSDLDEEAQSELRAALSP
jgi:hypothetical protein